MKKRKIIISCGGTGGHIFPAIEIAKSIKSISPNLEIVFVGALNKMEMIRVPQSGFPIIGLWIQGLSRKSIFKNLLFPIKLFVSLLQSFFILLYHRPICVIGTGGFSTGPILFVASLIQVPTYIQEQNCIPGLTNKILSKRAKKVFVANDQMELFFPFQKILNFGNPVRQSLKKKIDVGLIHKSRSFFGLSNDKFTILVLGGSLGAEPINKAINKYLDLIVSDDLQLIWQTGEKDYSCYSHLQSNYCSVHKFIEKMDLAYNATDLVISRAGAIAITEISFLKKASILIPSPYVTDDHQKANAKYLEKNDACILINESDLMSSLLIKSIQKFKRKSFREQVSNNVSRLFKYDAACNIAHTILKEIKK